MQDFNQRYEGRLSSYYISFQGYFWWGYPLPYGGFHLPRGWGQKLEKRGLYCKNVFFLIGGGGGVKLGFAPPPTNFNSKTIFQFKFDFKFGKNFRDEKLGMKLTKK